MEMFSLVTAMGILLSGREVGIGKRNFVSKNFFEKIIKKEKIIVR